MFLMNRELLLNSVSSHRAHLLASSRSEFSNQSLSICRTISDHFNAQMVDKVFHDWQKANSANAGIFFGGSVEMIENITIYNEYPNGGPAFLNVSTRLKVTILYFRKLTPWMRAGRMPISLY